MGKRKGPSVAVDIRQKKKEKKSNANNSVLRERLSDTNIFNGATAAETFDQFLAPLKRSEFDAKFYQKSHVKIDRSSNQKLQSRIQQLFNKERLESMFKLEKLLPRKDFLLTKVSYGSRCVQATCENNADCDFPENFCTYPNIQQMIHDQHFTLELEQPQRWADDLWRLVSHLEEYWQSVVSLKALATPKEAQYGPRFDNQDTFLLQLSGSATCRIWPNPEAKLPPFGAEELDADVELGEALDTVELRQGDCLYVPRGVVYETKTPADGVASSYQLLIQFNQDQSNADWLVQNLNTIISKTAMTVNAERLRENTPIALRRHTEHNASIDVKQYLKDAFAAVVDGFETQVIPSERPDRKNFFARRIGPYKQQGQTGKLKHLDLNCSVRLTTKEYIYVYTEDNIDEGNQGDDENEDYADQNEWEEVADDGENDEKKVESGTTNEIERILANRAEAGLDDEEGDDREEDGIDSDDEGDDNDDFVIIQTAWRNDRKQHIVNEGVAPQLMRYPIHYKAALDKLMKLKENDWLPLTEFELPAEEAIQFAVSLWAEGLLEPKE